MGESYFSHNFAPTQRNTTQLHQGWAYLETLRSNVAGYWGDDKRSQVEHDKGIAYIAIRSVLNLHGGLAVSLGRKRRHKRLSQSPTKFGPGNVVTKSLPSHGAGTGQNEEYDPVDGHPLNALLERPIEVETFTELDCYLTLQYLLTGEGPLWTVPNAKDKPVELWALPRALMQPQVRPNPEYPKGAWRVLPNYGSGIWGWLPGGYSGTGALLPGEEVERFLNPDPYYRAMGKSPLGANAFQVDIMEMIDEARWAAFDHGVTIDCVIEVESTDDAVLKRIGEKVEAKHGGARNSRRVLVVSKAPGSTGNKSAVNILSRSPIEMDFKDSHEQQAAVVTALYGVPLIWAGMRQASSHAELYAAEQQVRKAQQDMIRRKAAFYTRALCRPYERFPGEYRIQMDLPYLADEILDKQLADDAANGTLLYNEHRRARNRPPVPGGDVPVPIFLEMAKQKFAPEPQAQPEPQLEPGAEGQPGDEAGGPVDAAGLMGSITDEALGILGMPPDAGAEQADAEQQPDAPDATDQSDEPVDAEQMKAMPGSHPWDESKHKRDKGKFSSTGGASGGTSSTAGQRRGYGASGFSRKPGGTTPPPLPGQKSAAAPSGRPTPPPLPTASYPTPPATKQEHQQRVAKSAPKVANMAGQIPDGADVLANASKWATVAADKHADAVAAHLGISRERAHRLIRTTIEQLCNAASTINKTGRSQKTYVGAGGKKLKFTVKHQSDPKGGRGPRATGPTAGAPPKPSNPAARGSLPPRPAVAKAMSSLVGSEGGFLVAPPENGVKKRKRKRRMVRPESVVKGL